MLINYLLNKPCVVCFILRRPFHILSIETLKVVCFTHFHSLIKYGIIFWGNSTTICKMFIVQKEILRTMLGIGPRCSCAGWLVKLNILLLPSLHIFLLICLSLIWINLKLIRCCMILILGAKISYIFCH